MNTSSLRSGIGALLVSAAALSVWAAEPTKSSAPASKSPAAKSSATKSGAKGPLPDPTLLDGSALPAEKRSEHGMIGDFELPGDENVRNGRVGGPQNPGGGGGGQQQQQPGVSVSLPIPSIPMPGGAAGQQGGQQGGGIPNPLGGQQGAAGVPGGAGQIPQLGGLDPAGAQGGGAPGGADAGGAQAQGAPIAGGGDPNASAQGIQVGQLGGEGSQEGQGAGGSQGRPPPVAIGDSAMRIEQPAGGTPGVVGTQLPPGPVQQHDRGTGTGGRSSSAGTGANKGVERGRAIPSGL